MLSIVFSTLSAHSNIRIFGSGTSANEASIWGAAVLGAAIHLSGRNGRRLRVLIYARYSTEEQNASSIDDQIAYCRAYLARLGIECNITIFSDAAVSGETLDRPGLNRVWPGIRAGEWDLILAEDSSRLFRAPTKCLELVEEAVDNGIRVICINDDIDTEEEGWADDLREAQGDHARANKYTRKRIRRRISSLWSTGAAVTKLRPGYRRVATTPATMGQPAEGPFFDEVDPERSPTIVEAFERVAGKQPTWLVAKWLNEAALPNCEGNIGKWTGRAVVTLIRCELYRGSEVYGKTELKTELRRLRKYVVRRDQSRMLTREMEHLRIVSDDLWHRANDAINARVRQQSPKCSKEHCLFGIPRDSRGPLSHLFRCVCGAKMYVTAGRGDSYVCSASRKGLCWNRAIVRRSVVHERISKAIVDQLLDESSLLEAIVPLVRSQLEERVTREDERKEFKRRLSSLMRQRERIISAIRCSDAPVECLNAELGKIEHDLALAQGELDRHIAMATGSCEVSEEDLRAALIRARGMLLDFNSEVSDILRQLVVGDVVAVPYRQLNAQKVVLRAEFEIRLASLLPEEITKLLEDGGDDLAPVLESRRLVVDLFEPSGAPKYAMAAVELSQSLSISVVASRLGITKRVADTAINLGRRVLLQGLKEPYFRLCRPPEGMSRWRVPSQQATTEILCGTIDWTQVCESLAC